MRGPMSRRRLVPTNTSSLTAHGSAGPIASSLPHREVDVPAQGSLRDVCLVHVTEDGTYAAGLRDTLEAFGISVSTENVSMLPAESPRLRDPQQLIVQRHRLTVLLVSEGYELFHMLNGSLSREFAGNLDVASDRCMMAVLDDVHIPELVALRAAAVENQRRESSELLVSIKKRLDAQQVTPAPEHLSDERAVVEDEVDLAQLVKFKPNGWRTTLQAAAMADELEKLETKQREHQLGRELPGLSFSRYEASRFLQDMVVPDIENFLHRFSRQISLIKSNEHTEDPARVERAARDLVGIGEELLDWSARIRGSQAPRSWTNMVHDSAALADSLLTSVSDFVAAYCAEARKIREDPDYYGGVSVTLTFDLDSALLDRVLQEYKKVLRG